VGFPSPFRAKCSAKTTCSTSSAKHSRLLKPCKSSFRPFLVSVMWPVSSGVQSIPEGKTPPLPIDSRSHGARRGMLETSDCARCCLCLGPYSHLFPESSGISSRQSHKGAIVVNHTQVTEISHQPRFQQLASRSGQKL